MMHMLHISDIVKGLTLPCGKYVINVLVYLVTGQVMTIKEEDLFVIHMYRKMAK